jgi:hypothetical protein
MVGIAIVLGLLIWWAVSTPDLPRIGEETNPTPVPMWEFASTDLVKITVSNEFMTTSVEREPDGMAWRVTAPTPGEADALRLYSMADQIANMTSKILEGVNLRDFGLAAPQAKVVLELQDGTSVSFNIGDENPSRTDYYVQIEGDARVHMVPSSYVAGLLDMLNNPPYPATPEPPPSPIETSTPEVPGATIEASPEGTEVPTATEETEATQNPTGTPEPTEETGATEEPTGTLEPTQEVEATEATESSTETPGPTEETEATESPTETSS